MKKMQTLALALALGSGSWAKILQRLIPVLSVLAMLAASALTASAQNFSDWSAPVNLGPVLNTSSFEG